jgi:hypothetical protein
MLSMIQTSLKHLFNLVINPDEWTLDDPVAVKGSGNLAKGQTGRWARVMIEVPVLSQKIQKDTQPGLLNTSYVIQYRAVFRFPNSLRYHELPMRALADIAEYMTFLVQTHPDLLLKHPSNIDAYLNFGTGKPHVDPCNFNPQPIEQPVRDELSVQKLSVNSFIPVVEMDGGKDWICTLVWSVELTIHGTVNAYRQYFEDVFGSTVGGNQITPRPGLTGGLLNRTPLRAIHLGVYERSTIGDTDAFKPNPNTGEPIIQSV